MFPPGRARLATSPAPTGSDGAHDDRDRGRRLLGSQSARRAPAVTMTSTFSRTSSAARAGSRSGLPSAYRYSITTFWPST